MSLDQLLVLLGGLAAITAINWYFLFSRKRSATAALTGAVQELTITVKGSYDPPTVRVRRGTPVRLVFDRQETSSCSEEVVLPDFKIRRFLPAHQRTAVEFTPDKAGSFDFTCGMGMLHGKVVVE